MLDSTRFQRDKKIEPRILNFSIPPQELVAVVIKIVIFVAMSQNEPEHDPPPEDCKLLCAPLYVTCVGQVRSWLARTRVGAFPSGGTCILKIFWLVSTFTMETAFALLTTSAIPVSRLPFALFVHTC